ATRFRSYSKRFNKSHSEVLDGMMGHFKENNLDPFGEGTKIILESIKKLERQMMKKFDRLIAIVKNMEKTSIRPTYEMMLILYEAYVKDGRKPRREPVKIQEERMDFLETSGYTGANCPLFRGCDYNHIATAIPADAALLGVKKTDL